MTFFTLLRSALNMVLNKDIFHLYSFHVSHFYGFQIFNTFTMIVIVIIGTEGVDSISV